MSLSAGFRDATWPWGGDKDWHPQEPLHWEQLVAMFPYTEILFRPGSRYRYSNPGILFLGQVIERLSTDDYEVYVDKNLLKPLGMHWSYFDVTPYHLQKDKARGYYFRGGALTPARAEANTGITVSNGGLNAPLEDMARYLAFLSGGGNPEYEGVLSRASLEGMWQPVVEVSRDPGPRTSSPSTRTRAGMRPRGPIPARWTEPWPSSSLPTSSPVPPRPGPR